MGGIRPLPFRKVEKALRSLGFVPVRQRGSHVIFETSDGRVTIVPRHGNRDIGRGLIRAILKDAEVDWETFEGRT